MIYTIDELIGQHWAGCDVLQGETPEAYAIRHEREMMQASIRAFYILMCQES